MKKFLNTLFIVSFSLAGCFPGRQVSQNDNYNYSDNYENTEVSYQTFYDELQPYGNWINNAEYGYVWQPYANEGFRPYETDGRWVSTVDGWAWASDYKWGWAPFHYGRWLYDQSIGWAWVPGNEWAPAWVTWGQYGDYYAWAPLAPGINVGFGNTWRAPDNYWSFVPRNYINYSNLGRYTVRNNYNTNVNNITIINNYNSYNQRDYYHRGPDYREVEQVIRRPITQANIVSTNKPGLSRVVNKGFEVYRPIISTAANSGNGIPGRQKLPNKTRSYNGSVLTNPQNDAGIKRGNTNASQENQNDIPVPGKRRVFSNGVDNEDNIIRENIENTNRQLQQTQLENKRLMRTRIPNNRPVISGSPGDIKKFPESNPQDDMRRRVMKNSAPAQEVHPARPGPGIQNERNIQRPAFPQRSERIMQQPQSPKPNRIESRETNPTRALPGGRQGSLRRP